MPPNSPPTLCGQPPEPALLSVVVDHLSAMVAYWDAGQRCRFANRAYERWFGVDPTTLVGRTMRELLGPLYPLNAPYIEGALRGERQEFERVIPDPAGGPPRHSLAEYVPDVADDGQVRGFCVLVTDISRLKQAEKALLEVERQLQASERLAGLATLAAGIAHEINNPLAAVLAHTDFALEGLSQSTLDRSSLATDLRAARDGAGRVGSIVQSLKLLARGDATRLEFVDVNDTVERSIELVASRIKYRARVIRELQPACCIQGNPSQLAHVLVNLLMNAAQALTMQVGDANEIRVTTRQAGDRILIEVADNGCGVPEALRTRIFEPFFSTKAVGDGMGLGLSLSSTIVKGFGGTISVASELGKGSVFTVALPACALPAVGDARAPGAGEGPHERPRSSLGRPRVLLIDDEPAVTKMLERVFAADYEVTVTNNGADALRSLLDGSLPSFDLVLCDLMMPEPGGEAIFAQVSKARAELADRFIFMTGGAFTARGRHFLDTVPVPVLDKPFDLARLRALAAARAARV